MSVAVKPRKVIKNVLALVVLAPLLSLGGNLWAATASSWPMEPMDPNLQDLPSLQNGWRLYMNYCIGCHSLQYQRYERTADDLGVPHELVMENLMFTGQKIGEQMTSAIDPELAKNWFGAPPPDLTLVARVRGVEWLYNYLKTFYLDDSRPFGVNNKVFENVGMPNVLLGLQGTQTEDCIQVPKQAPDGGEMRDPLEPGVSLTEEKCGQLVVQEGTGMLSEEDFNKAVFDIVNFLYYTGEPSRLERHRTGLFVVLFLIVLYVLTFLLGREFQKDVKH